ncbi:MAG: hypothetical protein EU529_02140 [Promethearchaeota archaeon]|nr:MAG: hypothetical protein EU529_02140 [Candidatus Lokiarchaeota archaeon]
MPKGLFIVLLPREADYKILGYYLKNTELDFEVSSDLFLRLNLDHSKNTFNFLKLKNYIIISYLHNFTGKISRKASGIIVGVLLNEGEEPEKFRAPMKNAAISIESLNFLEIPKEEFEEELKAIYEKHIETLDDILNADVLKERIINLTKEMLSEGKKERRIAQELLQKIEDKVHTKISEYYKAAESALKSLDYERAGKLFNKAAEVAEELKVRDLAKSLRERASLSVDIPDLSKKRDEIVREARSALRKEDFHAAYTYYKKASELSKKLMQTEKEEEYTLKSKALQDFYQAEQRFQKKQ